jgi:peptide/nickel transport system permease protein
MTQAVLSFASRTRFLATASAALWGNPKLLIGLLLLLALVAFSVLGPFLIDLRLALPISVGTNRPPSAQHWLGTDSGGRELFAVLVSSTPQTLRLGLIAGAVGVTVGSLMGLLAGFFGGIVDRIIGTFTDVMLTIPPLAILLIFAASVRSISVEMMALIIAALSWMNAARAIRAQVLSLRELPYVDIARVSGMGEFRIALFEVLPNLFPIIMSGMVGAVSAAILAALGLEVLGFGPQDTPTLGMTIYWALLYGAFGRNMWWWWLPPIIVLAVLFVALFLISAGLDEAANPRLRRAS